MLTSRMQYTFRFQTQNRELRFPYPHPKLEEELMRSAFCRELFLVPGANVDCVQSFTLPYKLPLTRVVYW